MRHTRPSTLNRQIVLFPPTGPDRRVELAAPQRRELIRALAELLLRAATAGNAAQEAAHDDR